MNATSKGVLALALLAGPMAANAALVSVDGGLMVDDTTLNVTWANTVASNVTWSSTGAAGSAQAWVANLNSEGYGGYSNWILATGDATYTTGNGVYGVGTGSGASTSGAANQLGYLLWNEIGNASGQKTTIGTAGAAFNTGTPQTGDISLSTALIEGAIWSGTEYAGNPTAAYYFYAPSSVEYAGNGFASYGFGALAVRDGLAPVPLPAPAWLLLSALGGLGLMARSGRSKT